MHLGDALGSVRQLVDSNGTASLAHSYEPYGELLNTAGPGITSYGFTGEWTDSTELVYLRARYYNPGIARFQTRDVWQGDIFKPVSQNKWNYAYSNPAIFTDPTGEGPIETCLTLFAALAVADGPIPAGDVAGILACTAILGGATITTILAAQHAPDVAEEVEKTCNWIEWLYTRPVQPSPQEQPSPKPQPLPVPFPQFPKPTETPEPKHVFYFSELGDYFPGRDISQSKNDLEYISYIDGIPGLISQLESAPFYPLNMGRKFEAERAIYYYNQQMLQEVNSTSTLYDLLVTNMGTIKHIEVKWAKGTISKTTLTGVIQQVRLHPSYTFLLETTWITLSDQAYLNKEGGRKYP